MLFFYTRLIPTIICISSIYILIRRIARGPFSHLISKTFHDETIGNILKIYLLSVNLFDIQLQPISVRLRGKMMLMIDKLLLIKAWIHTWFLGVDFDFWLISSLTVILIFSR